MGCAGSKDNKGTQEPSPKKEENLEKKRVSEEVERKTPKKTTKLEGIVDISFNNLFEN